MDLRTKLNINVQNLIDKMGKFDWYLLNEQLYGNPKYKNSKRITHYGKTVFSQTVKMALSRKFLIESEQQINSFVNLAKKKD